MRVPGMTIPPAGRIASAEAENAAPAPSVSGLVISLCAARALHYDRRGSPPPPALRITRHAMPPFLRSHALLALAALGSCTTAFAQQKPPAPNPQAPTLKPVAPSGMRRGTTLELTLTGANLAGPTGLWTSFPAKVTIPTDANNGKDNGKLRVRLDVPKDAPLGLHALRLATHRGMSNLRVFCIDDLPQVAEVAGNTNRSSATAQPLTPPCVVAAKADAEVTDFFKVTA